MGNNSIFVYLEQQKGSLHSVGLEMLTPAREMAERMGGTVCGVVIGGEEPERCAAEAAVCGADVAYIIPGEEYKQYSCDAYAFALAALTEKYHPSVMMIGSTSQGRDLAPRVACRLKTGLTADVTGIRYDETWDCLDWDMPAYGGQLMATIICPEKRPQMETIRQGVFEIRPMPDGKTAGEIVYESLHFPKEAIRTEEVKTIAR